MAYDACYRSETVHLRKSGGFMEGLIDAAYILTIDGSVRTRQCLRRVLSSAPLNRVTVQHNRTYAVCNKHRVTSNDLDIRHAIAHCIRGALARGDKRVILMEDDCEFIPSQITPVNMKRLATFLDTVEIDAYLLGCVPMISTQTACGEHLCIHRGGGLHATIWTRSGMQNFLNKVAQTETNEFVDVLITTTLRVYAPIAPFAVQKHPDTTNSKQWMRGLDYVMHRYILKSHLDGVRFYMWCHRCGSVGGTYVVFVTALTLFVVACRMLVHCANFGRSLPR